MRVSALICISLAACGRIGFDATDARRFDDATGDAPVLVVDPPFGAPMPIGDLNTANSLEDDPMVSADQLEIFFTSSRPGVGGTDIWTSTRANATDSWQPPTNVAEINTIDNESNPALSADRLTLVYSTGPAGDQDLYIVTRSSSLAAWGTPTRLNAVQSGNNEFAGGMTDHLDALYFSSIRTGDLELFVARGSAGSWGSTVLMSELSTPDIETSPFVMLGESVLWFASSRPGTAGGQDIWVSTRVGAQQFAPPTRIAELATTGDDSDPCLSPDGHIIYFSRTGANGTDLMMATR